MGHDEFGLPGNFYILKKKKKKGGNLAPYIENWCFSQNVDFLHDFFGNSRKLMLKGHSWTFSKLFQKNFSQKTRFFEFSKSGFFISKNDLFSPFFREFPKTFMTS